MENTVQPKTPSFGMRDKVSYAAGDFGGNMSFALKSTMILFWTQAMHMRSSLMAILLLIVQIWDAVNDPLLGSMIDADRRRYKLGKFRTYILVGAIGLTVAGAFCFLPIEGAKTWIKSVVFVLGYMLWDAFYTIANVPYGSMLSLISEDGADRAQLSTWRSIGSMVGQILTMVALPFLIYAEDGETLLGDRLIWIALVMGIIGFLSFWFMLKNTTLRVDENAIKRNAPAKKFNVFKAMKNFCKNRAAIGATLAAMAMFIGMQSSSTATSVMFQFYFGNGQLSGVAAFVGFLPMFLFIPFIRKLVNKWGKQEACIVGSAVSVIGGILLLVLPITPDKKGIILYIIAQIVFGVGLGFYSCISWSLMADAIDYNEWRTGMREEGTVYSLHSFFRKLAQGVGPSIVLAIMGALGYINKPVLDEAGNHLRDPETNKFLYTVLDPNVPHAAENMRWLVAGLYAFSAIVMFLSITFVYNLNKKKVAEMTAALAQSRAANAQENAEFSEHLTDAQISEIVQNSPDLLSEDAAEAEKRTEKKK